MNNCFIKNLVTSFLLVSLSNISFAATSTKITVNGMVCSFCAQGIEKRLSQMPATKAVFVDLKNKVVAVEAKDGMTLDNKLIAFEITEAGYDVVKTEASQQSVAEIKASLKGKK
ncbi:MAG: hypothetical protein RLY82_1108 [Pseudomonadota bacterium]|jgi:mercuric ion binding protein